MYIWKKPFSHVKHQIMLREFINETDKCYLRVLYRKSYLAVVLLLVKIPAVTNQCEHMYMYLLETKPSANITTLYLQASIS